MAENTNENFSLPDFLKNILKNLRLVIILVIIVIVGIASVFQVETEERGVITKFGKYDRTVDPGLNFKLPFVEQVYKVPVERQQKLEFGFHTKEAGVRTSYGRTTRDKEIALMLTGDLNLADVEWVVQYRISDPYEYLFKCNNPEITLQDISEAAMRQIVGDRTVNEVLTTGRAEIEVELQKLIQDISKEYSLGVKIEQVVLQDVNPPESVKPAFNSVNEAQQEKSTLIDRANKEYFKVIPKAKGQAEAAIQEAEGYATERTNKAKGEVARFNDLYTEYVKAKEVTKRRIYLEKMAAILPKLERVIITDDEGNNVLPLLQMQMKNTK